jgi:hypothetical protein
MDLGTAPLFRLSPAARAGVRTSFSLARFSARPIAMLIKPRVQSRRGYCFPCDAAAGARSGIAAIAAMRFDWIVKQDVGTVF